MQFCIQFDVPYALYNQTDENYIDGYIEYNKKNKHTITWRAYRKKF